MVKLNKIYTKTGDFGETSLGNGDRNLKFSKRVTAYGTVDELNAHLGLARCGASKALDIKLKRIQNDLFDLGADLCKPYPKKSEKENVPSLRIVKTQTNRLEAEIDKMNRLLQPLKSFVIPGGSNTAAQLHVCRTVCRRAERHAFQISQSETINKEALKYLNRLSDWLFVSARIENDNGKDDILWKPGSSQ